MGNLYNTEAIITALLEKKIGVALSHIRGMKDLKKLKLFHNQNYSTEQEVDGELPAMFSCPITKMEFNGNHPFVAIWTTGYVLSEKAIKELGIDSLQEEYGPFTADDLVRLIPTSFETEAQTALMLARRTRRKEEKNAGKQQRSSKENSSSNGNEITGMEVSKKRKNKDDNGAITEKNVRVEAVAEQGRGVTSLSKSASLAKSAADSIKVQQGQSTVFKGLFHSDKEKDMHDRDLFMSVAGIRYTLG